MASSSAYLRDARYNATYKNTAFQGPAVVYMALHTGAPGLTGANEVSGNGYARQAVTFSAPTAGAGTNTTAPTFPGPTPGTYGVLTHLSYWDAVSAGNMLTGDALTNPITTSVNVPVTFPVGTLTAVEL